jgi:protein TonB
MNLGPGRGDFSLQERPPELTAPAGSEQKQRRLMLIALALLLVALIVVLVKDRQFWFPSSQTAESDGVDEPADQSQAPASATQSPGPARPKARHAAVPPTAASPTPVPATPAVTASRAVLPPLEVEVIAGGQRQTVAPSNNSIKVELQPRAPGPGTAASAGVSSAAERVQLSADTAQVVARPVQPNYPLLAKQMKVQGAVVLQALIGKEGAIQDLQVVSGPAILSSAAREAVMQWRFKPYYQAGQPVETEARITVNFTISTY